MKSTFLKLFLRNFSKHKWSLLSGILSMSIAIACCIVAYLNYDYTNSFDDQHIKKEKIFKVNLTRKTQHEEYPYGVSPAALGPVLINDIADIEYMSRFITAELQLKHKDHQLIRNVGFADLDFLEMFTFPMIQGEKEAFAKNAIFITKETATALFGEVSPVGESIEISNAKGKNQQYVVVGIFESIPYNNSTQFDALLLFDNHQEFHPNKQNEWRKYVAATFLTINNPEKVNQIETLIQAYVEPHNQIEDYWQISNFWIEPLVQVPYSQSKMRGSWLTKASPPSAIIAPIVMAILILLNACFNFSNTAIAISNTRLKEIGIKKVLGIGQRKIIRQFTLENFLISMMALLLGVAIAYWLAPAYSNMWPYINLELNLLSDRDSRIFLIVILILTVILGGAYPAFYVGKFKPSSILSKHIRIQRSGMVSRALLSFQFIVTVLSLIAGITFVQNAIYQSSLDQGYIKEDLIVVPLNDGFNYFPLKNQVMQNPDVLEVAATNHHIASSYTRTNVDFRNTTIRAHLFNVGVNYLQTVGIQVKEGRGFSGETYQSDSKDAVIINEKLIKSIGLSNPIGEKIFLEEKIPYRIIGVVKDFHTSGLWKEVEPTILRIAPNHTIDHMVIRVMESRAEPINRFIGKEWSKLFPDQLYSGFVHQTRLMANSVILNQNIIKIFAFLSIVALLISSLGLYSLVSLDIIARTKEIGIRKVMGVSLKQLSIIVNKPFLVVLSIAFLIGSIASAYIVELFLDSIWTYNVGLNSLSFFVPVILLSTIFVVIALFNIYKAFEREAIDSLLDT